MVWWGRKCFQKNGLGLWLRGIVNEVSTFDRNVVLTGEEELAYAWIELCTMQNQMNCRCTMRIFNDATTIKSYFILKKKSTSRITSYHLLFPSS